MGLRRLTRGRERNTARVVTEARAADPGAGTQADPELARAELLRRERAGLPVGAEQHRARCAGAARCSPTAWTGRRRGLGAEYQRKSLVRADHLGLLHARWADQVRRGPGAHGVQSAAEDGAADRAQATGDRTMRPPRRPGRRRGHPTAIDPALDGPGGQRADAGCGDVEPLPTPLIPGRAGAQIATRRGVLRRLAGAGRAARRIGDHPRPARCARLGRPDDREQLLAQR